MTPCKWTMHLLFFASVLLAGVGFDFYYRSSYDAPPHSWKFFEVVDTRKGSHAATSEPLTPDPSPPRGEGRMKGPVSLLDLDGNLLVILLATDLLGQSDADRALEEVLRTFQQGYRDRLIGGSIRLLERTGRVDWSGEGGRQLDGFRADEVAPAFTALFAEVRAVQERRRNAGDQAFHTIVLWKCNLNPEEFLQPAGNPEPPQAGMTLIWLADPDYPRSSIPPLFKKWFGVSIMTVGTRVELLVNVLPNLARKYPNP